MPHLFRWSSVDQVFLPYCGDLCGDLCGAPCTVLFDLGRKPERFHFSLMNAFSDLIWCVEVKMQASGQVAVQTRLLGYMWLVWHKDANHYGCLSQGIGHASTRPQEHLLIRYNFRHAKQRSA